VNTTSERERERERERGESVNMSKNVNSDIRPKISVDELCEVRKTIFKQKDRRRRRSTSSTSGLQLGSALISLGILVVVGSSVLSAFGFKGRQNTVGIDLGTTFSVVAVKRNGTTTVIPDELGRLTTPSVVTYRPDGKILVGHDAIEYLETDPNNTIFNAKRFIGRKYDDPIVKFEMPLHPFEITERENEVRFKVQEREIRPEDVGSSILKRLKQKCQDFMGYPLTTTVVAVPADFGMSQKKATRRAFLDAGFDVARIIDEPTAAAVAYGLHQQDHVHHVLVFDLGGGTLDTSLLHIQEGSVQVLLQDGDNHLGGEDFDQAVMRLLERRIMMASTSSSKRCSSRAMLKSLAENAKRTLSREMSTEIKCDDFRTVITREEFEEEVKELIERALIPVRRVLENTSMRSDEIDEVVMVGGSSRIPRIREAVSEFFGGLDLKKSINPDLAVAIGAASILD